MNYGLGNSTPYSFVREYDIRGLRVERNSTSCFITAWDSSCDVLSMNGRAGAGIIVLAVVNSAQVDEALFGPKGAASGDFSPSSPFIGIALNWTCYMLKAFFTIYICAYGQKSINGPTLVCDTAAAKGTLVIVCSTVAPAYIQNLEKRLTGRRLDMLCWHWFSEIQVMFCFVVMIPDCFCAFVESGILLVDAPISGGAVKAAAGTLTVDFYSDISLQALVLTLILLHLEWLTEICLQFLLCVKNYSRHLFRRINWSTILDLLQIMAVGSAHALEIA